MKKATKVILGTVLIVSALGTIKVFAGGGEGCGFRGHGGAFSKGMMSERMAQHMSSELNLTPEQQHNLDTLISQIGSMRNEWLQNRTAHQGELLSLIEDPTLDQDRVLEMVTLKTQTVNSEAPEVISAIANFTDSLNAEQKSHLKKRIEQGIGHRMSHF